MSRQVIFGDGAGGMILRLVTMKCVAAESVSELSVLYIELIMKLSWFCIYYLTISLLRLRLHFINDHKKMCWGDNKVERYCFHLIIRLI